MRSSLVFLAAVQAGCGPTAPLGRTALGSTPAESCDCDGLADRVAELEAAVGGGFLVLELALADGTTSGGECLVYALGPGQVPLSAMARRSDLPIERWEAVSHVDVSDGQVAVGLAAVGGCDAPQFDRVRLVLVDQ